MSSRPAWPTQRVPGQFGLHSETLPQTQVKIAPMPVSEVMPPAGRIKIWGFACPRRSLVFPVEMM